METRVRLMLIDDHPLVRDGLRSRLQTVPGFEVIAEANSAEEALAGLQRQLPDVVLLDIALKAASGIDLARQLHDMHPQLRIIMLTMHDQPQYVIEACRAGACGYVLKDSPAQEIVAAVQAVMAGRCYYSSGVSAALAAAATTPPLLTQREREILSLLADGLASKEIAHRLQLSVRTVETHRLNIKRKCELEGSSSLVKFAVERRWQQL
ncbi:MAG: DNA-binding response regulator [Candidatus Dactylopiibacterium carminicum]|uniref:DNA-binding response regulator n=1 Tax=Candidatus Dactylopiibacterium carminicum TaxID=857335 RepID=A0A272ET55_9RHOO|nr:response regulator transcription factor [Candidatus Dactylopiibacterium carminicum]KAF7599161.1 DNA-binding response regulator [Candidatus Dactylopiibacterium carminicum]PAS93267.1 MAG: DNA-binding response regulator [Candidatus Dactylopiibacterium carminicum]PAS97098.1 MAG: DNA-binding response regulator [Candidatus Dactylopiibacterium carminicum]PAS99175.1 MAG: DNA-binding response regulator [Candidatus Dactylopiibacterium carminicum]